MSNFSHPLSAPQQPMTTEQISVTAISAMMFVWGVLVLTKNHEPATRKLTKQQQLKSRIIYKRLLDQVPHKLKGEYSYIDGERISPAKTLDEMSGVERGRVFRKIKKKKVGK